MSSGAPTGSAGYQFLRAALLIWFWSGNEVAPGNDNKDQVEGDCKTLRFYPPLFFQNLKMFGYLTRLHDGSFGEIGIDHNMFGMEAHFSLIMMMAHGVLASSGKTRPK